LEVISLRPACQLLNTSLLKPREDTACSHLEMISRIPFCQLARVSLPAARNWEESAPSSDERPPRREDSPPSSEAPKLLTPPLESSWPNTAPSAPLKRLVSAGASIEARRPFAKSSLADSESSFPCNSEWRNSSISPELIEKSRSRRSLPSRVSRTLI